MRSRDGSSYLTRTIYSLVLLTLLASLPLDAKEYLISYRYIVRDAMLHSQSLQISDAMQKCDGNEKYSIVLPSKDTKNIRHIISNNSEEFIDYIHKLGMHIEHKEITKNSQNSSTTTLTLKTTCFKVDFNDSFAKITPLNKGH